MTRIHPRHHVSRRNRVPAPHPKSTARAIEAIGRAIRELCASLKQADYSIAPHGLIPPIAIGPGIQRAVEREQQEARMVAKFRSLGIDDDTREALIQLATAGVPAPLIRNLAHDYTRGQAL